MDGRARDRYDVQVVDKTVVDHRDGGGDGSSRSSGSGGSETRFVCRLVHYDMTWPRVRVDQLRRPVRRRATTAAAAAAAGAGGATTTTTAAAAGAAATLKAKATRPRSRLRDRTKSKTSKLNDDDYYYDDNDDADGDEQKDDDGKATKRQHQHDHHHEHDGVGHEQGYSAVGGGAFDGGGDDYSSAAAGYDYGDGESGGVAHEQTQLPCSECSEMQDGIPAASVACMLGHVECLRVLLEAAAEQHQYDRYDDAEGQQAPPTLAELVDWDDDLGRSPLHFAVSSDAGLECAELLLRFGYSCLAVDAEQRCPLHYASSNNAFCCVARLLEECAEAARLCDAHGDYPLHAAVVTGSRECAQLLLQMGAEPDARNQTGHTAACVRACVRACVVC